MNKYFSKALLYADKKTLIPSLAACSFLLMFGLLDFILGLYRFINNDNFKQINILNIQSLNPSNVTVNMYVGFIAICIATIISLYNDKDKKYYYMLTQPYSIDSIVITKTIGSLACFIVPIAIYGIVCFIILTATRSYYGIYYAQITSQLFIRLLTFIILLTFITVFLQLMQMLFGTCVHAIVLPPVLYLLLFLSSMMMRQFTSKRIYFLRQLSDFTNEYIFNLKQLSHLIVGFIDNPYWLEAIILILASTIIVYLTILLNRNIAAENTSSMFMFKASETVFNLIIALFLTLLSTLFICGVLYYTSSLIIRINYSTYLIKHYGIGGKESIEQNIYLILNIIWIPAFIMVYKAIDKTSKIIRRAA